MGETRIVAVSDVLLDQPWPTLGPVRGTDRRNASRALLVQLVQAARSAADVLLVVGNLFDRRSVMPTTIDVAGQAFAAFPGDVLILPGASDWYSDESPYATTEWPGNVHVYTQGSAEAFTVDSGITFWAAAMTSRGRGSQGLPGPGTVREGVHVAVVQESNATAPQTSGLANETRAQLERAGVSHVIVGGGDPLWSDPDRTFVGAAVGSALDQPEIHGATVLHLSEYGGVSRRERLDIHPPPLRSTRVDVSPVATSDELAAVVASRSAGEGVVLRLAGTLHRGVLLANTLAPAEQDLRIDVSELRFDLAPPEEDDATAAAEFVRGILDSANPDHDKHQAIALGMLALNHSYEAAGADPSGHGA